MALHAMPGQGLQRLFERRMAKHAEPHAALHAGALLPEELLPAKAAHEGDQLRVVALDDRAAFVEQREQVAPAAAAAALAGNLLRRAAR